MKINQLQSTEGVAMPLTFARRAAGRSSSVLLIAFTMLSSACDSSDLLEVDVPGRVPEEALNNPALAGTLVNGVMSDLECAWDSWVALAAIHSDQFIHSSGNAANRSWGQRRITADDNTVGRSNCGVSFGLYTPLQTARYQADDIFNRLASFPDAAVANKVSLQATVRAYGGYALIALGEGFCEMAIHPDSALVTPDETLQRAEVKFTEAISLATTANNTDILNMALVGRARARLDLENFAGAIADAGRVPAGYIKLATRDATDPRRSNKYWLNVNGPNIKHHTVSPAMRNLTWKGVADSRVRVVAGTGRDSVGFDFLTRWFFHNKGLTQASPHRLASYTEAQLIIAEASARSGDLTTARTIINQLHTAAGLPSVEVADAPTQADLIRLVIEERNRELFAEGGHRLNDHLRFRGTPFNVPFKGEAGSVTHPTGVDHIGQQYGTTTCFPLPAVERAGRV
jgi:hypothetical protein